MNGGISYAKKNEDVKEKFAVPFWIQHDSHKTASELMTESNREIWAVNLSDTEHEINDNELNLISLICHCFLV